VGLQAPLLIAAVVAVGILHTLVPDHWLPIALLARRHGWSRGQVARTAAGAGIGHALSTIAIGVLVWIAGEIAARRFAHVVDLASSIALVVFGAWVIVGGIRELRESNAEVAHSHVHVHADGTEHAHWHEHPSGDEADHVHEHKTSRRMALLLVLGSSPMIEGIPAFFAASRYGVPLVALMAALFTLSTVATYVVLCVGSAAGTARINLGPLERYGEILSGAVIAILGAVFLAL
jgi:putative Mn2+ efflux pump MntP